MDNENSEGSRGGAVSGFEDFVDVREEIKQEIQDAVEVHGEQHRVPVNSAMADAIQSPQTGATDDNIGNTELCGSRGIAEASIGVESGNLAAVVEKDSTAILSDAPEIFRDRETGASSNAEGKESSGNDEGKGSFDETPKELSEGLPKGVVVLQCESTAPGGICNVYLVGTAHVSQESCREVQAVIRFLKPQVVFLELCSSRLPMLAPQNLQVPTISEMVDMWKNKHMNAFGILYSWFLAKVAEKLEVFPGSEFRTAFEEAMAYGAKVTLGDRPVQITLRRTWAKMSLWHKTRFLFCMFFQAIFLPTPEELNKMMREMDDVDMLTLVIQEMSKTFPSLMETLLHERDLYMSSTLLRVANESNSVVAVVGKGHLSGIAKNWKQPVAVNSLLEVPEMKSSWSAMKLWSAVAFAVGGVAIVSGLYFTSKR